MKCLIKYYPFYTSTFFWGYLELVPFYYFICADTLHQLIHSVQCIIGISKKITPYSFENKKVIKDQFNVKDFFPALFENKM